MNLELNNGENLYVPENDKKYILAKLIVGAEAELGYSLTYDEAKKLPRMPKDLNVYALYFGSFKKACDTASVVVKRKEHPEQAVNYGYRRWIMDKREEILSRVTELSFNEHGNKIDWLDEKAIKRDSVLVLSEVMKAFGGVRQLREAAKERLRREKYRKKTREIEEVEKMSEEKNANEVMNEVVDGAQIESMKRSYKKWTKEEIIQLLRGYYDGSGKLPTDLVLNDSACLPTAMTVRRYLGDTREEWLKAIGVTEARNTTDDSDVSDVPVASDDSEEKLGAILSMIDEKIKIDQLAEVAEMLSSFTLERRYEFKYRGVEVEIAITAEK